MAIVGVNQDFKELTEEEIAPFIQAVNLCVCYKQRYSLVPNISFFISIVKSIV